MLKTKNGMNFHLMGKTIRLQLSQQRREREAEPLFLK